MQLEQKAAKILIQQKKTLALAESCTGGLLSDLLTNVPGSSKFLMGAVVAYDNSVKTRALSVPPALLKVHGAVSAAVARVLAQNVRKLMKTDLGIGITGIAGPGGGTKAKPVGLVYIALSHSRKTDVHQCHFKGTRLEIKRQAAQKALKVVIGTTFLTNKINKK